MTAVSVFAKTERRGLQTATRGGTTQRRVPAPSMNSQLTAPVVGNGENEQNRENKRSTYCYGNFVLFQSILEALHLLKLLVSGVKLFPHWTSSLKSAKAMLKVVAKYV